MTSTSSSSSTTTFTKPGGLKRLGPVRENASFFSTKGSALVSDVYSTLKQYVPKGALPHIANVEDTVSSYSYPAFAQLQDRSDSVLKSLDGQVDYFAKHADSYYGNASSKVSASHKDNMERFHASRKAYLGKIQEAVEYVKSNGITGGAKAAADNLSVQINHAFKAIDTNTHFATEKVQEAWTSFQGFPIVQKFLGDMHSLSGFAWGKYMSGHDAVLGHPAYHKAYSGSLEGVSNFQGTTLYQKAKTQLYPSVAPYADPALDKLQANSYYKAAVDHIKPVQSNGKLT